MTDAVRAALERALRRAERLASDTNGPKGLDLKFIAKDIRAALADTGWREEPTDKDIQAAVETIRRRITAESKSNSLAFQFPGIFVAAAIDEKAEKLRAICEDRANARFGRVLLDVDIPEPKEPAMTDARTERARKAAPKLCERLFSETGFTGTQMHELLAQALTAFAAAEVALALEEAADAAREKCYQYDQHALGVLVDWKIRALKEGNTP